MKSLLSFVFVSTFLFCFSVQASSQSSNLKICNGLLEISKELNLIFLEETESTTEIEESIIRNKENYHYYGCSDLLAAQNSAISKKKSQCAIAEKKVSTLIDQAVERTSMGDSYLDDVDNALKDVDKFCTKK